MAPLPPHPALPLPPELEVEVQAACATPGPLRLRPWEGVPDEVLVRFLHTRACEAGWLPLVQVPVPDAEARVLAGEGWLHSRAAGDTGAARGVRVEGRPLPLPPGLAEAVSALDTTWATAVDPGLAAARATLLAHCRPGAAVLLCGATGSGREELVRWAWSRRAEGAPWADPLDEAAPADAWQVVRDPALLTPEELRALRRRIRVEAPPPPPASRAPVPRPTHPAFAPLLGESPAFTRLLGDAARVARTTATVLLLGEPGTGKELLARAIHEASGRSGPFHPVDLAAVPRDLVESELFGHVRGAFTGAAQDRPGAFRRAEGGTLFLDELGNLDLAAQAKLLRVLQERVVRPVGSERGVPVDVRVLAATNADLDAMVAQGRFRLDLLHRLNAITLRIPPLRERLDDIPRLALRMFEEARGAPATLAPAAAERLRAWPWPGNVRELWGLIQRAAAFAEPGQPLDVELLEPIAAAGRRGLTFVLAGSLEAAGELAPPVSLTVPPLPRRSLASRRHQVLAAAPGRAWTVEAVDLVAEGAPNLPALRAEVQALAALTPGVLDRAAVARVLPERLHTAPLRVELAGDPREPAVSADRVFVGRARSWEEVGGADEKGQARLRAARLLAGGEEVGFYAVPWEPSLSRAHLLLRRDGATVVVEVLPEAAGAVFVRGPGGARGRARPGAPVEAEGAVEVEVELGGGRRLRLLAWVDRKARARLDVEEGAAARAETARGDEIERLDAGRVWALGEAERRLLNRVVAGWSEGDFSAHLRAGLTGPEPEARRLAAYLLPVRPTQYCARLYAFGGNTTALAELAALVRARGDAEAWLGRLPAQMAAVLGPALDPPPGPAEPRQ